MKLNWGQSLFLVIIFLISLLLFGVFKIIFSKEADHELVSNSYYEEELDFQKNKEKIKRGDTISHFINVTKKDVNTVEISFTQNIQILTGEVYFYCPFDKTKDFKIKLILDESNKQIINSDKLISGQWILKFNFIDRDSKDYMLNKNLKL